MLSTFHMALIVLSMLFLPQAARAQGTDHIPKGRDAPDLPRGIDPPVVPNRAIRPLGASTTRTLSSCQAPSSAQRQALWNGIQRLSRLHPEQSQASVLVGAFGAASLEISANGEDGGMVAATDEAARMASFAEQITVDWGRPFQARRSLLAYINRANSMAPAGDAGAGVRASAAAAQSIISHLNPYMRYQSCLGQPTVRTMARAYTRRRSADARSAAAGRAQATSKARAEFDTTRHSLDSLGDHHADPLEEVCDYGDCDGVGYEAPPKE